MNRRPSRRPQAVLAAVVAVMLLAGGLAAALGPGKTATSSGDVVLSAPPTATPSAAPGSATAIAEASPVPAPTGTPVPAAAATPTTAPVTTATATSPATPTATPVATPQPRPALLVELRPQAVGTGDTLLVTVSAPGASELTLDILDARHTLRREGEWFWGLVGVPLDTPTGSATLLVHARDAAGATLETASATFEVLAVERPVDYLVLTGEQAAVLTPEAAARESALRTEQFTEFDAARRWAGLFLVPVAGITTTEFGQGRSYNGGPVGGFHTGMDIAAAEGTPLVASGSGRVAWVGEMPIRGLSVVLDHGGGVKSGYHHLRAATVAPGELVGAGGQIGLLGSTGLATGPHLHWEVTVWGVNVDPVTWTVRDFTP